MQSKNSIGHNTRPLARPSPPRVPDPPLAFRSHQHFKALSDFTIRPRFMTIRRLIRTFGTTDQTFSTVWFSFFVHSQFAPIILKALDLTERAPTPKLPPHKTLQRQTSTFEPRWDTITMMARRREKTTMVPPPLQALIVLGMLFRPIVAQETACFETLGSINSVMQTELSRIQNGATPQESYVYSLCSNTFLDAGSEPLQPVLDNTMFVCGDDGSRSNRCVIVGGNQQVLIRDSLVSGYPLQELNFMGITFSAFETNGEMTGSSISALASSTTTATFTDCTWQVRLMVVVP